MALWLPPLWHKLKPHLEQFRDAKNLQLEIYTENQHEILDDEAMLYGDDSPNNRSPGESTGSRVSDYYALESSDDETEFHKYPNKPATLFIIFTKDDIMNSSAEILKQRIVTTIEVLRMIHSNVKLLVIMHSIRIYALHGQTTTSDSQESLQEARAPHIHSVALDDIICSLMIEHRVDTIEAEDDVDLAKFMILASSSVELCSTNKIAMAYRTKPLGNVPQEISLICKTWIMQLQQIPEVGRDAAATIANIYKTPAEIMEAVAASREEFVRSLRNLTIGTRGSRKLGINAAKRYSSVLVDM
ncbi:uncharacterized protein BXIN_3046 [Babesia sp. Xinjiang]|uniref:uncharacterized protein n=1 Tax=Babesia sp. Xinjiang TaxID=462227 RepID=UPI000A259B20|nr:uncharacterized protein BXIN_3046 [Babesia sp. Xinjiang]ORM39591.1 hypothetical protein BXIN_3046 [Babesia sp. Xinjiang]